ncbi:MAG: alpha/beta fold hydrolase [Planctomycetia bacterium]|nr:alpha/beta fold hydrolase [Planctomycetia bacterium]
MSTVNNNVVEQDTVVLVHGLASLPFVMQPLAKSLGKHFGQVVNWSYSSLWSRIERHGRGLAALLRRIDRDEGQGRIHLIGHSMGGIIGRVALAEYMPQRIGRFLMLAPPNRGSHVARRLAPFLGRICPPLHQLADHDNSFVCTLPPPRAPELGIIAASGDFMVLEHSTRLGCERDYIVLPGLHSSMLWRAETSEQVRHFLEHGKFRRG